MEQAIIQKDCQALMKQTADEHNAMERAVKEKRNPNRDMRPLYI